MILRLVAVVAALTHLAFEADLGVAGPFVKAVPVAVLASMVAGAASLATPWSRGRKLAAAGLAVSALADMAIEWSFLAGLAAFLAAHLLYIGAFVRVRPVLRVERLVPLLLWAGALLPALVRHAGGLAVPVAVYGCVIFVMMWRAAATFEGSAESSGRLALAGALLFGLSDSLLGWNRFVAPFSGADLAVMATYWSGQVLIASAFSRRS